MTAISDARMYRNLQLRERNERDLTQVWQRYTDEQRSYILIKNVKTGQFLETDYKRQHQQQGFLIIVDYN